MNSPSPPSIEERLADWILGNRPLIIVLSLLLLIAAAFGAQFLTISSDQRIFFGPDNPQLLAFDEVEETFEQTNNIFFVIDIQQGEVFSPKILNAINALTEEAWDIPYTYRVDSVTNYQYSRSNNDELEVDALIDFLADDSAKAYDDLKRIALNDDYIAERLISKDTKVAGILVQMEYPEDASAAVLESAHYARELRDRYNAQYPQWRIYLTGTSMINTTIAETTIDDSQTLIPAMYGIVIILLMVLLRSVSSVIITVIAAAMSIVAAMGIGGYLNIALTPPSIPSATVILTIVVAHCVHILVAFFHQMRRGDDRMQAMRESLRINIQPVFLTSLTTFIGFLSMNVSDIPPVNDFGNIVAAGVVYALLFSLGFMPAVLTYIPIKVTTIEEADNTMFMDRFADFVIKHQTLFLWLFLIIGIGFTLLAPTNELNDQFSKYFDEQLEFRRAADFADDALAGGLYGIEYVLESGQADGITDPEYLAAIEKFAEWLRAQPHVTHVAVFSDVMKRLNKNMHNDDPAFDVIPNSKALAAQYLFLYEMSLPSGLDLSTVMNQSKSATRLTVAVPALQTQDFIPLQDRAYQWLKDNTPESMHFEGASISLMFTHIGYRAMVTSIEGAALALGLISFVLLFALKSIRLGLISLVPNMLPAGVGFGIWALLDGNVGMAFAPVLGVTMGIVVDDTVHFLSKYRRALTELKLNQEEAIRYAFHQVGVALWVTTFVLTAGFLILTLSLFKPNNAMGTMASMIIVIALILDFFLLPPLLMKFARRT